MGLWDRIKERNATERDENGSLLYDDMAEEVPFWATRSGQNRIDRVTKMFQMGFISVNEARAMLGGP